MSDQRDAMASHPYDLTEKVVLITGGNGGIGGATARELLGRGGRVVIANAGLLAKAATLRNTPVADLEATFAVNVTGVANTVAAAMEPVIENRGQVVVISSVFAYINGMGTIPYAMSKAAVEQLGRGLRVELAEHGVSVLTAYFSLVQTQMVARGVDEDPMVMELLGTLPKAMLRRITPAVAAGAIVDGLERRSARVIRPALWRPVSLLRGLLGPALDARFASDRRILDVLARLDARTPLPQQITREKDLA